jgi:hypothetical protein
MAESAQSLFFGHGYDLVVTGEFNFSRDHGGIKDKSVHFLVHLKHPGESFFGLLDVFADIFDIVVDRSDFVLLFHGLRKGK